jgi:predicted esterase
VRLAVRSTLVAFVLVVLAAAPSPTAEPAVCAGCVLELPRKPRDPVPLLVVLHGDRERPGSAAARWRAATTARGWALLALPCPRDEGCADSWWRWNGDPAHVIARVEDAVIAAARRGAKIDRARIAIAGWSGGATYLGLRAQAWGDVFSGIVLHGGGMAPGQVGCAARRAPAYFLVGDRNPLHALAVELRVHLDGCEHEVVWDLVRGGDHAREARSLDRRKATAILDWLSGRPRS